MLARELSILDAVSPLLITNFCNSNSVQSLLQRQSVDDIPHKGEQCLGKIDKSVHCSELLQKIVISSLNPKPSGYGVIR